MTKAEQATLMPEKEGTEYLPEPVRRPIAKVEPEGGVLSMIERLAANPDFDVEKLKELVGLQERILKRNSEMAFNAAMSAAQKDIRPIAADADNPQTRSKYATYAKLDRALRPIYTAHGFGLSFDTESSQYGAEYLVVLCYVTQAEGHQRTYRATLPADGKGAKGGDVMTKTHAVGAGMSYGMRYLLKMIFNVAVGEEDVDGNDITDKPDPPKGFEKYWTQLSTAAEKGTAALEAVWACSQDEPYKSYRKHIAQYGKAEMDALKVRAKQVGK